MDQGKQSREMSWRCYKLEMRPQREARVGLYRDDKPQKKVGLYFVYDRRL